jgi:hypothetical protein
MPDDEKPESATDEASEFEKLRGLLKGAFDFFGGGEAFLRRERNGFYARDTEKEE